MNEASAKRCLRAELRYSRDNFVDAMSPDQRKALEERAANHLAPLLSGARSIAFYVGRGSEIGCCAAIGAAAKNGATVALPRVESAASPMQMLRWSPGDPLEPGWRGLLQPLASAPAVEPEVIVAPLLGFDLSGWRIGQGAGFYDRAFAAYPRAARIGLGWSVQRRDAIAHESWDIPLAAIVTEQGVIEGATP